MDTFLSALVIGAMFSAQYALIALGFTLVFGILGVVNFAHGSLYMLGGYLTYWGVSSLGLPFALAVTIAVVLTGLLGAAMEVLLFHNIIEDHVATLILSLGVSMIIVTGVGAIFGHEAPRFSFPVTGVLDLGTVRLPLDRLVVMAVSALAIGAVCYLVLYTGFGRSVRALAQDQKVARSFGINPRVLFATTLALSSGLAALAGALVTPILSLSPHAGESVLLTAFVVVILGGLGSIQGATVAAILTGMIQSFASIYIGGSLGTLVLFVLVIAVLVFRPSGLFGAQVRGA
ncbi:branched-chain amino acid transport system permease protein [Roseovarius sp. MBR-79]|jgi:branched-chain amino acid transport system permease protein